MQINLIPDSSVGSAPAGFTAAIQAAAAVFDQDLPGNYTVNITYGWGTYDGAADDTLTNPSSGTYSLGGFDDDLLVSYAKVKSWLGADAAIASLPATPTYAAYSGSDGYPSGTDVVQLSNSQLKALGEYTGSAGAVDGSIGFNVGDSSDMSYLETAAFVEIGHALGWFSGYETPSTPSLLDLFRYGSPGVYQWVGGQPAYFSLDGGQTDLADFSTSFDFTLFKNVPADEPFNLDANKTDATALTGLDLEIFNLLGFGLPDVVSEATPATVSQSVGATTAIGGVQVIDAGAGDDSFTTIVTAGAGDVSASGDGVTGSGSRTVTVTGGLAAVNAALGTLAYSGSGANADTVRVTTADLSNQSGAAETINVAAPPISVADYLANVATFDALDGGFTITDSAANVSAALGTLDGDPHLRAITLDDSGEPILSLTVAEALSDMTAIRAISNASFGIDIADTEADLAALSAAEISALAAERVVALISTDATIRYTFSQSAAIAAGGLAITAPANDLARESFASGASNVWIFGADDALVRQVQTNADGSFEVTFDDRSGTFLGAAYSSYDVAYSPALARLSRSYLDASGAVVASMTFLGNGGYDAYVGGTLVKARNVQSDGAIDVRHYGAGGTIGPETYAGFDVAFTANGARVGITFYDADDDLIASKTFTGNGGFTLDIGGVVYETKTVNADGSFEVAFDNIAGQTYTSDQTDFDASGVRVAHSTDYGSGAGALALFGSGLQISQGSGSIGPGGATSDFSYASHASETYAFFGGATDDTLTFSAGFGAGTINGLGAAGVASEVLNLTGLFASYSDAQAAMTTTADGTTIVDGRGDTLTLVGVTTPPSAAQLGFG